MKKTYEVEILGQKFNIKSAESQAHVDKVVTFVTSKMKELNKSAKAMTAHHLAILTLLNIADDLFKKDQETLQYKEKIMKKAKNILHMIDVQPSA